MRRPDFYRYFLGIRPPPELHPAFQALADETGQSVRLAMLHLTFCVIAERAERDRFIARRIRRILDGRPLHSFAVNLGTILTGPQGATARTVGRQDEVQDFYRVLIRLLRASGIEPLYRKSGLHPHVTLGYDPRPATRLDIGLSWFPAELLLIDAPECARHLAAVAAAPAASAVRRAVSGAAHRRAAYCRNKSRPTISRMIWLVPSRIECTRKSRQKRSIG